MALKDILTQVGGKLVVNPKTSINAAGFKDHISGDLAWNVTNRNPSVFFSPVDIDPQRADGIFPYRLLVVDSRTNRPVSGSLSGLPGGIGGVSQNPQVVKYKSDTGGVQYIYGGGVGIWEVVLPITPQQLSITDQFAINTSATMRGVVEEHNGVKFKMITASGTYGIWPSRDRIVDENSGTGIALFGGVVESLGNVARAGQALISGSKPKPTSIDFMKDNGGRNTGYFQAELVQQFLEQYAMLKKNPANKNWRLVFDCPKINQSFVVTPITYTASKSQRSPGEILFNMQFKAWKRIRINQGPLEEAQGKTFDLDANFFQRISNTLDNARSLMSASLNVVKSVRADFRKPFDQLRKVTLLVKDFAGLTLAVSDLPNQIGRDISSATRKRSNDLAAASQAFSLTFSGAQRTRVSQTKIQNTLSVIKEENDRNEGLTSQEVEVGLNGIQARDANRVSPVNEIFENPEENFDFFSVIAVDELELTPKQTQAIEDEIEVNSLISVDEVRDIVQDIQDLILDISNVFGAGDAEFSKIFGRPAPRERAIPMTIDEFELLTAMEAAVLDMNILSSTREFDDTRTQTPLEYVGGLADDSDIPFNSSYTAKFLAPVPFGLTIEQISSRYLGSADLYNEIVTINNLRSPYIDEDGFFYSFLSNGDGRQFNIDTDKNLYIGQKIQLSSNTVPMFTRKIANIEKISDNNYLITVDGLADLENLKASEGAKIKAFLPGTVNSQNQIYIPTNEVTPEEPRAYDIPFLQDDTLTGLSKIDWLLTENGDVVLNSFGEAGLANGITNLVQALKMKVVTTKGAILDENNYGLGINPGTIVSDIAIENIMKDLEDMILEDPRFDGIESMEINVLPPDLSLTISVRLANNRGIFPINFTV